MIKDNNDSIRHGEEAATLEATVGKVSEFPSSAILEALQWMRPKPVKGLMDESDAERRRRQDEEDEKRRKDWWIRNHQQK